MSRSEYRDTSDRISSMMYEAKLRQGIKDKELGARIDLAPGTLKNMRSQKTTCNISFWKVMLIAQMAGYEVKFERR